MLLARGGRLRRTHERREPFPGHGLRQDGDQASRASPRTASGDSGDSFTTRGSLQAHRQHRTCSRSQCCSSRSSIDGSKIKVADLGLRSWVLVKNQRPKTKAKDQRPKTKINVTSEIKGQTCYGKP